MSSPVKASATTRSPRPPPRLPTCARCRHHGHIVRLKGHAKTCPFTADELMEARRGSKVPARDRPVEETTGVLNLSTTIERREGFLVAHPTALYPNYLADMPAMWTIPHTHYHSLAFPICPPMCSPPPPLLDPRIFFGLVPPGPYQPFPMPTPPPFFRPPSPPANH
ncbi:unnamed protein product [Gadus morhua 'NCC']